MTCGGAALLVFVRVFVVKIGATRPKMYDLSIGLDDLIASFNWDVFVQR